MALNSPGVQVSVIDQSFYLPAAPSTTPMIFVASKSNKENASGTGIAPGTDPANAGKVWLITSQRDLSETFGTPLFYTDASGNPIHGGELNEYGLQAAYSLLGVSSQAYVVRADLDLGSLLPQSSNPEGQPVNGTYWLDTSNTKWGIFEWSKVNQAFTNKVPLVIDNSNLALATSDNFTPKESFGTNGSYCVVATTTEVHYWYKNKDGNWVQVGDNVENNFSASATWKSTAWQTSWPVATSTKANPDLSAWNGQTFVINNQTINLSGITIVALANSINAVGYTKGFGARVNASGYLDLYADATAKSNGTTPDGKLAVTGNGTGGTAMLTAIGLDGLPAACAPVRLFQGSHTKHPDYGLNPSGSVYVKTTAPNAGANWSVKVYSATSGAFTGVTAPIYADGQTALNSITSPAAGSVFVKQNYDQGTGVWSTTSNNTQYAAFEILRKTGTGPTTVLSTATTEVVTTASSFNIIEGLKTSTGGVANYSSAATISLAVGDSLDVIISKINAAGLTYVSAVPATYNADGDATSISIEHSAGGEIKFLDDLGTPLATLLQLTPWARDTDGIETGTQNFYAAGEFESDGYQYYASSWKPLVYQPDNGVPYTDPATGTLWYSSVVDQVDILYHNGDTWVSYLDADAFPTSDPAGPQVAAVAPTTQSDGTPLVNGDIWIDTSDINMYGKNVYVYNGTTLKWVAQDTADQTTPNGWLFADARWSDMGTDGPTVSTSIKTLLSSNYIDPDAPDPALYPKGMRLWNTRRSGFNVKRYESSFLNINANDGTNTRYENEVMNGANGGLTYEAGRWVTVSPNNADGTGAFGHYAQRGFVVAGMKAQIDTNQAIRDTDTVVFNLIACPGYPEAIQNMIGFNIDRGQTAFVIGDTPFNLKPTGTDLQAWGLNTNGAFDNNETGAVSYDNYMAMYYPSGYTNDNTGNYIVVPPSHMMLRTMALNDQQSFEWFAPAGTRRGNITNATSVGYVMDGEFKSTALPNSLRDVLASVKINPIATLVGSGIVAHGQYTRAANASSLDRINVARLVCYLRRQLDRLVKPYLFEPNDKITRNEIKASAQSFLIELVSKRAIYDFAVVCDESNNTPTRIDRSELWLDIAIEPVKAVEFIYIPLRLKNTGAIKAGL
jgi:hypothetical protein